MAIRNNILFISERAIKENSIIEENTDSKLIRITVQEVQSLELLPLLGRKLFAELEDEIIKRNNDQSYEIPDNYLEILDNVKPFLIYGVLTNIQTALTYKATNKGFNTKTDTSASTVQGGNLESVTRYYRGKFDAYKSRLRKFLKEYNYCSSTDDTEYSTGWYLPEGFDVQSALEARAYKTSKRGIAWGGLY